MKEIISEVIIKMNNLTDEQEIRLTNIMYSILSKYEITEKSTELRINNTCWDKELNYFISHKLASGKSEKTCKLYKYHLQRLLSYLNKNVNDITEQDLSDYLIMYKNNRKVSNCYLNGIRLDISSFFSYLYKKEIIDHNPSSGVDKIKVEKVIKRPFTDEELEKLRMACKSERDLALVEFLYSTGIRVSELVNLDIKDIDFQTSEGIVYGKGAKQRKIYLNATSSMHLKNYLKERKDLKMALFISQRKPYNRLTKSGIERILIKLGKCSNVENVYPHRFRRTMATNILKKGMPIEEVKELLGHTKLDTTMIYCNINQDNVKNSHRKYMCA